MPWASELRPCRIAEAPQRLSDGAASLLSTPTTRTAWPSWWVKSTSFNNTSRLANMPVERTSGADEGEVIFGYSFVNLSDWVLEGERPAQERRDCIDGGREQIGFVAQDVQASWREEFGRGERLGENGGEEIGCQAAGAEFHVRDQIARREFPGGRISRARGLGRHRAATWRGRFAQAADPGRRTSSISARTLRPQQVRIVSSLLGRWP